MTRARISQVVLLVTLAVYPVIPGTTGFTGSSFIVMQRVLVALLLVATLVSWPVWKPRIWRLRVLRVPAYLFIAFLGVGVLSAIVSPSRSLHWAESSSMYSRWAHPSWRHVY